LQKSACALKLIEIFGNETMTLVPMDVAEGMH
jgi:hypothetical protein